MQHFSQTSLTCLLFVVAEDRIRDELELGLLVFQLRHVLDFIDKLSVEKLGRSLLVLLWLFRISVLLINQLLLSLDVLEHKASFNRHGDIRRIELGVLLIESVDPR